VIKKVVLAASVAIVFAGSAQARDQIQIVGSSTVFPFSTAVAEAFGQKTSFGTPVVESTGSGGGMKLFCAGVGTGHPDITNASRRIKSSEVELCAKNGVTDITEVKIGYDGIVIANALEAPVYDLSLRDIFLALAKDVPTEDGRWIPNPNMTWKDVNASLPAVKIEVLGPPPTSGTRDAFVELAMEGGCKTFGWVSDLKKKDKSAYKAGCHTVREDGGYIDAGENDNLMVQKLTSNPNALAIFGYSFLDQNADKVKGSPVNGVAPEFELIADGSYPVSRAMFFYVKQAHIGVVPGIEEYVAEFSSEAAWGNEGYLTDKGLIPMSDAERAQWSAAAKGNAKLSM
tara:strand:- start:198 stop:1226 length:1029 start_codon:yes stop_codon:yes gene_type:complete